MDEGNAGGTGTGTGAGSAGSAAAGGTGSTNGTAGSVGDWRTTLPETLREHAAFKDRKDLADVFSTHANLYERAGRMVAIPGKDAKPEERDEFFSRLGRPKTPAEYIVPEQGMPDGFKADKQRHEFMSQKAHALGITKDQYAELARLDAEYAATTIKTMTAAQEAARAQGESDLRSKWGEAFEERMTLAQEVAAQFGILEEIERVGLGNSTKLAEALVAIGMKVSDSPVHGTGGRRSFKMGADEAKEQIAALKLNKEFMEAMNKAEHPGHKDAVRKHSELMDLAYPDDAQAG